MGLAAVLVLSVFAACAVDAVEALTIVLAVGTARGWSGHRAGPDCAARHYRSPGLVVSSASRARVVRAVADPRAAPQPVVRQRQRDVDHLSDGPVAGGVVDAFFRLSGWGQEWVVMPTVGQARVSNAMSASSGDPRCSTPES
jgi:hypothetical protein